MYNYEEEKPNIFKEENQKDFLFVRDNVHKLLSKQKYVEMSEAIHGAGSRSWLLMAYVDRLRELGEIVEITQAGSCAGQDRVFRK